MVYMPKMSIPCTCGREREHRLPCPIALAFRFRCPECRSVKRGGLVGHANHCTLKDITRP